jgi:putative transposase
MNPIIESPVVFFTATIFDWKKLLQPEKYKKIIADSLAFLVKENRVKVYAFTLMDNHIHLIWQALPKNTPEQLQRSFLRFTAQQIKFDLQEHHPKILEMFYVGAKDRMYQFWERNPLSVDLYSPSVMYQKLEYIHENPVRAGLCSIPEDYKYSSASFYETGETEWVWLSHIDE